jgi:hypothetical protein
MLRHSVVTIAISVAVVAPMHVGAQPTDAIPREAVLAILRNYNSYNSPGEPQILAGDRLPAHLATRVSVPPGARIIASLIGPATQVIGSTTGVADSVRAWFAGDFQRRGYRPARSWYGGEAFRPADRSAVDRSYCGDGLELSVSASQRRPGLVEFVLRSSVTWTCASRPPNRYMTGGGGGSSGSNPPDLPLLFHPTTAEVTPGCSGFLGSGSSQRSTSSISTAMGADQLLNHYGRQLDSAGWKRAAGAVGVSGAWTKRDSTGRDVRLLLAIDPGNGGDCRNLSMTATESRP